METQALGGGQTYLLKLIGIPNLDLDYAQWEVGQSFCSLYSHDMPVTVRLVSLWWSYSPQSCLCLSSLGLFCSNLTSNSIRWFSNSYSIPLDSIEPFSFNLHQGLFLSQLNQVLSHHFLVSHLSVWSSLICDFVVFCETFLGTWADHNSSAWYMSRTTT